MTEINMNEEFVINSDSYIRSVSIILYDERLGFLLCNEYRKDLLGDKHLQSHVVGGKVEIDDISPIHTGFREFCEELNFQYHSSNIKKNIQTLIDKTLHCKRVRYDFLVSPKKRLYNRFYIINIGHITDVDFKNYLFRFLELPLTEDCAVQSVYFWKKGEKLIDSSSLLINFLKILPSSSKLA